MIRSASCKINPHLANLPDGWGIFKQDLEYSVTHGLYKFHSNVHEDNGGSDLLPILITSASSSVIA